MSPRLNIDFINQKVRVDNQLIKLTPIEYQLLILLVKNKDQIVSYQQIMEEVWGKSMWEDTDNLRIYIRRLRKNWVISRPHDPKPAWCRLYLQKLVARYLDLIRQSNRNISA